MEDEKSGPPWRLLAYIYVTTLAAGALAVLGWHIWTPTADTWVRLVILCALGILSWNLREPDVGSRISFSFLSIVLLGSAAIVGPWGAAIVGFVSVAVDMSRQAWYQRLFNMSMCAVIGAAGAVAYVAVGGATELENLRGAGTITLQVGLPLVVADVVECLTNAILLAGVMHFHRGHPFVTLVRRIVLTSGLAYMGYGVIGFLLVILWFPAQLGAFSAILVLAPLLAARWAFIQYGEELRSHERTIDTLVTALGTKEPPAVERSRRTARLAEWIAEELGLGPTQIGTVRYAATLHEIGHLGVPARLLRRDPASLTPAERQLISLHCAGGAGMIEGIDFLEAARSGIRHQGERFDGSGGPDGLAGHEIPLAARIVAVASRVEELSRSAATTDRRPVPEIIGELQREAGRYDPLIVAAARTVMDKHVWPVASVGSNG